MGQAETGNSGECLWRRKQEAGSCVVLKDAVDHRNDSNIVCGRCELELRAHSSKIDVSG